MYCRERVIHADSAYYLFNILYDGQPYIATIVGFPSFHNGCRLLLRESGASLPTLSLLLTPLALMGVQLPGISDPGHSSLIRHPWAGLALALSMVIANRYKFYTGISEIFSSISLVALLMGWLTRPALDRPAVVAAVSLLVTTTIGDRCVFTWDIRFYLYRQWFCGERSLILRDKWKDWPLLVWWVLIMYAVDGPIQIPGHQ